MMDFALPEKHRKNTRILFIIFSLFAVTISLWMFLFNIDIISNAEGQVIPAGEVKTVQHLEGGIIDQILIKESDVVKNIINSPLISNIKSGFKFLITFEKYSYSTISP